MGLLLLGWIGLAVGSQPLDNQQLELHIGQNQKVSGWYYSQIGDCVLLSRDGALIPVHTALVQGVTTEDGGFVAANIFQQFLHDVGNAQEKTQTHMISHPKWVSATGYLWSGLPFALIDDPKRAWGTSAFEGLLFGGVIYGIWRAESWGAVLPFALTILSVRSWSVRTTFQEIRPRESNLELDTHHFPQCFNEGENQ